MKGAPKRTEMRWKKKEPIKVDINPMTILSIAL